jgi:Ankyrin repeats (3 copies)
MIILNEKLLKYIPVVYGGNALFPIHVMADFYTKYPKTRWTSFDQKSFFPHSDGFKMKIGISHEDLELISTLLSRGFDVNSVIDNKKKTTAMGLAALLGRVELIDYFFSKGSSLNSRDFEGNTPLMLAVMHNQFVAAKKLILLGADINAQDRYGFTALDKAKNRGRENFFELLENTKQQDQLLSINPVTYKLEHYEYLSKNSALEIRNKFDPKKYYKPIIYPYFKISRFFSFYLFGGFDLENFEIKIKSAVFVNPQDDKLTSDQQLFTFGEILVDRNKLDVKE